MDDECICTDDKWMDEFVDNVYCIKLDCDWTIR